MICQRFATFEVASATTGEAGRTNCLLEVVVDYTSVADCLNNCCKRFEKYHVSRFDSNVRTTKHVSARRPSHHIL